MTLLVGNSVGQSAAGGEIRLLGFYEIVTNAITKYFDNFATSNGIAVHYDNDPTESPVDQVWCKIHVDFGEKIITGIGQEVLSRVVGILNIIIYSPIGIGVANALNIVDIVTSGFRLIIIDTAIKFQVPKIRRIGRVEDNYQVNVLCPFTANRR